MSLLTIVCNRNSKAIVVRAQHVVTAAATTTSTTTITPNKSYSTSKSANKNEPPYYSPLLSEKRPEQFGRGGRASNAGVKVAVFGATGFLGEHFCAHLGANGFMTYVGNRGCDMETRSLKVSFDLGRFRSVFYSPRDIDSVREVIADADIVVNLIGKYTETGQPIQIETIPWVGYQKNYTFHDMNVKIPTMLAQVCKEMQIDHFVHVSHAGANPNSKSENFRTKYEGELAVRDIYPWATIVRPTQLYGWNDRLTNWFAKTAYNWHFVPLIDEGTYLTQPVFVGDVAQALLAICDDFEKFVGRDLDLFGPQDFTYKELAKFVQSITEKEKPTVYVPHSIARKVGEIVQWQRDPLFTPDTFDQLAEDCLPRLKTQEEYDAQPDINTKILTLRDLSITPLPIEKEAFNYLHVYRYGGAFYKTKNYHSDAPLDN